MGSLDPVVVIIATHQGREPLLLERALPSVFAQDGLPCAVVIVEDSERVTPALASAIHEKQRELGCDSWPLVVSSNRRTIGASGTGAWNTGAEDARTRLPVGGWLAFLDDDDAWLPGYLQRCVAAAQKGQAALVVSGLLRIDARGVEPQIAPPVLTPELFFASNPGIQASNLFISLDVFDAVGGFDESFPSTTDRDLMIRVLDYLSLYPQAIVHVPEYLVKHYAHDGPRVTTNKKAKHDGLNRFYARYGHRMNPETLTRSLERAERLFGYRRG